MIPKMYFSHMDFFNFRHIIAILHFNENVHRQTNKTKDGRPSFNVTFPKYKLGDEVVREVTVQPTYGNILHSLFLNMLCKNGLFIWLLKRMVFVFVYNYVSLFILEYVNV